MATAAICDKYFATKIAPIKNMRAPLAAAPVRVAVSLNFVFKQIKCLSKNRWRDAA